MIFPILGAIALATGTVLEKMVLKRKNIKPSLYQATGFLAVCIVMIPLLIFFWDLKPEALELKNIIIFFLVVLFTLVGNYLVLYSMKWEKINNLEPAKMLEPFFTILLALAFSFFLGNGLYERDFSVIIPAIIAGAALVFSHLRKHHLEFNKYFKAAVFGSLFFALELVISRMILDYYSPMTFYFFRCVVVLFFSLIIFKPDFKELDKKSAYITLITVIIWVAYRIVLYYGYTNIGIVQTTLMVMLGPIFIYVFAWKFLKEKINWRNIVASIVILACVLYGTLF